MDNRNYIVINGKKAELTKEQLKQLGIEINKPKRWRAKRADWYWCVGPDGHIHSYRDFFAENDNFNYDTRNYFRTETDAQEYAKVLETRRQLMKFADEHNDSPIDWNDEASKKYSFVYDNELSKPFINRSITFRIPTSVYFSSERIAEQALAQIGEDKITKYLLYEW